MKCDYLDCNNEAEYLDTMDSPVCEHCMQREVEEGLHEPEEFESI